MSHKDEYLIRMSDGWFCPSFMSINCDIETGKYEGSGYYRMIHAESFDEAIEKWNENDCPTDLKRLWGECGVNESLVMVINHKGRIKYYM
jgi:hypothetical protein